MKTITELDLYLTKKYPKMFRDRHASMMVTCLCWGLEIGDGWSNILEALCANIQSHINWSRKQRSEALKFNRALKKAVNGDKSALINYNSFNGPVTEQTMKRVNRDMEAPVKYRDVPEACSQVVISQIKEKFGTLRFYYSGGDDIVSGMVDMAESMSACTCDVCGNPGKPNKSGWISVRCNAHSTEIVEGTDV